MQGCPCLASHAATLLGPGLHQPVTQHVCWLPCMLLTQEGPGVAAPVRDDAVGANVVTAADGGQSLSLRWTIAAQQASNVKAQDTSSQVASGTQRALSAQAAGAPLRALHGMHPLPSRDPLRTVFHRLCERGRRSEVLDEDIVAEAVLRGSAATSGPHALGTGQACALKLSVHEPWLMPTHFERKLQSACSATSIQATLGNVCWMQALLRAPSRAHPVCEVARRVRAQLVGGVVALRGQAAATMSCSLGCSFTFKSKCSVHAADGGPGRGQRAPRRPGGSRLAHSAGRGARTAVRRMQVIQHAVPSCCLCRACSACRNTVHESSRSRLRTTQFSARARLACRVLGPASQQAAKSDAVAAKTA